MFERFNGNVVPFADESTSTNRTVFGSETQSDDIDDNLNADFKKGWEIVGLNDNPTREDFNAMGYTLGYLTSYLYQNGVAEYNLLQEYKTNSIAIGTDGNIYQSLVDNNIGNAFTDTTKWVCIASKNSIVNSIDELKTISNIESINVLGYYEKGDGGGGTFYWDATSTETDNGGTIIQATGVTTGRWKRVFNGAVNVKWFGAVGDGVTDNTNAINNAINSLISSGGIVIFPEGNYVTTGNHIIDGYYPIILRGFGTKTTLITHNGNNVCFNFTRTLDSLITYSQGIEHMEIIGSSVSSNAVCIQFSDRWGQFAKNLLIYGYSAGSAIYIYNNNFWTEATLIQDVMIRGSLYGIKFGRKGGSSDTSSFYNTRIIRTAMSCSIGNSIGIFLPHISGFPLIAYESEIDMTIWFEGSGGNKKGIVVQNENVITGKCNIKTDGIPTTNGSDFNLVYIYDGGFFAMDGKATVNQSTYNKLVQIPQLIKQQTNYQHTADWRPNVYLKGAKINFGANSIAAGTADSLIYSSGYMPPFSTCKVRIAANGWNTEWCGEFLVTSGGFNHYVTPLLASGVNKSSYIALRPIGNGTPGAYSVNSGLQFEIYMFSSISTATIRYNIDIEMI